MLKLDHLVIIAPSLDAGVAHVRDQLGVEMSAGGEHPQMGTHNRLLRLSDAVFLEVIAINPAAPAPAGPRWFGMDDVGAIEAAWEKGRRLRAWVAQTGDIDKVITRHEPLIGTKTHVSRGDRSWQFALLPDGAIPVDGVAPPVIAWGERGNPAPGMPDLGVTLRSFHIAHPDPDGVRGIYRQLEIVNPPGVSFGNELRYHAVIETPSGLRELF
jgi:hypothetical protein